jgi:hypothetical protein
MAKDGTDVMKPTTESRGRELRSKHSAGNEAVARNRGGSCVAKLWLT